MTKCNFCGRERIPIRGVHLIKNDGSVNFFCSSKCRKNALKLKRDKRRLKWTESYHEEKAKLALKHNEKLADDSGKEKIVKSGK